MKNHVSPYASRAVGRGLIAFLLGRGISALLTFASFSLIARTLPIAEYGYYAAAIALTELLLALATGGIDWVAARTLPESRMNASGRATSKLVGRLFLLQAFIYLIASLVVFVISTPLSRLLNLHGAETTFQLASLMLLLEGIGRLSRDQMLGILMEQQAGQLAQVARSGIFLCILIWEITSDSKLDAAKLMALELYASFFAAFLGTLFLGRALLRLLPLPASNPTWTPPESRDLFRLALHTYTSYLLAIAYGPQVLTMVIARLLGAEAVAIYGFARGFADQVRRYLPTDLLQSVVRPTLIAFYSTNREFSTFALRLAIWFKSALVVLFPVMLFFIVFGEVGVSAIGGLRFASNWPIVAILLCGSGVMAWRRVVELAANTVMATDITVRASLVLLASPLIIGAILIFFKSLLVAVIVAILSEAFFCWRVMNGLKRRGFNMSWERRSFFRLGLGFLICLLVSVVINKVLKFGLLTAVIYSALSSLFTLLLLRPLTIGEGQVVGKVNRKLAKLLAERDA